MSLDSLDTVGFRIPSVPVHDEGDVFGDRTLAECADQEFAQLVYAPFRGWRG